jgi:hypothetical protein
VWVRLLLDIDSYDGREKTGMSSAARAPRLMVAQRRNIEMRHDQFPVSHGH